MRVITFIYLLSLSLPLYSQFKYDYTWLMGTRPSGPLYPQNCMNVLTFGGDTLKIKKDSFNSEIFLTNASISDEDGNLLFYSNGCYVKDANHQIMPNGDQLNPGQVYDDNCPDYGYTALDGLIILPQPFNSSKYYIFHQAFNTFSSTPYYRIDRLYYSVVNMSLNNGQGEVIVKNQIILDKLQDSGFQAIKHLNNNDWWVIVKGLDSNVFYKVLLNEQGIASIDTQSIGGIFDDNSSEQYSFTPDGNKFMSFNYGNQLKIFDFDRNTGVLSNYKHIVVDTLEYRIQSGLAISPNSRYAYVSMIDKLYQLDLESQDIEASRILVGEFDGFLYQDTYPVYYYSMRLGPDCKIYMTALSPAPYLHVINNPDEPGLACGFVQHGIELPCIGNYSMPNFPNYRLGTGYPVCDSNIVYVSATGGFVPTPVQEVRVWPNPAREQVSLSLSFPLSQGSTFHLFDQLGREVRREVLSPGRQQVEVGLAGVPSGLYFWSVEGDGKKLGNGKLIIAK